MKRFSIVRNVKIRTLLFSAIFQVGDNLVIAPKSRVFAVQREIPTFIGNEGNFFEFPIFSKPIPQPLVEEQIHVSTQNVQPYIQVDHLDVLGVSTAAVIQIGSNKVIVTENRTKHIRQLLRGE